MHMIRHRVTFDQLDIELLAKLPQDPTDIFAKPTEDCFLPVFRYDNNVVTAIPFHVALPLPVSHRGFSY
jgi:hypothetical protein